MNCLTAKDWIKAQLGVWEFYYERRDVRDKNLHPAVYPLSLAKKTIELFTHRGELVIDPFVGSGTTLLAAQDLDRNAVGFDINRKYIQLSKERLAKGRVLVDDTGKGFVLAPGSAQQLAVEDDAHNIPEYLKEGSVGLILTSPPYANLLNRPRLNKSRRGDERRNGQYRKVEQYSQDPRDLGTHGIGDFAQALTRIYEKLRPLLKPKGHCVINVADTWWDGHRVPIHVHVIHALEQAGYELRNTIIWDRRNIVNRVGIFGWPSNYITMGTTFEYLLDFWNPPS